MRPKPRMPSVLSISSTPENFERSQRPSDERRRAPAGTLRASASSSAIVCSAAVTTLDCGALATTMPRLVAAGTSTLSTPTPARPMALQARRLRRARRRSSFVADADEDAVVVADARRGRVGARRRRRRRSARAAAATPLAPIFSATRTRVMRCRSTTQSMHAVSAWTSAGSMAGNIADAQLVAPELAVGLDVDDAVGAQRGGDRGGVDAPRRSRSCPRPASAWPGRRRTASRSGDASAQP